MYLKKNSIQHLSTVPLIFQPWFPTFYEHKSSGKNTWILFSFTCLTLYHKASQNKAMITYIHLVVRSRMSGNFFECPQHAIKVWYFGKWRILLLNACRPEQLQGAEFFLQSWYVVIQYSCQNTFCFYGPQSLSPQSQKPTIEPAQKQFNSVCSCTSCFSTIHLNVISPHLHGTPKQFTFLRYDKFL